jgi:magnesium transporter
MAYGPYEMADAPLDDLDELRRMRGRWPVLWVDAGGLEDAEAVGRIGEALELDPAELEALHEPGPPAARLGTDERPALLLTAPRLDPGAPPRRMGLYLAGPTVATFRDRGFPPPSRRREAVREDAHLRHGPPAELAAVLVADALDLFEAPVADAGRALAGIEGRVAAGSWATAADPLHALRREVLELRRLLRPLVPALADFAGALESGGDGDAAAEVRLEAARAAALLDRVEDARALAAAVADLARARHAHEQRGVLRAVLAIAAALLPLAFLAAFPGVLAVVPFAAWVRWTVALAAAGAAALVALALVSRLGGTAAGHQVNP